MGSLDNVNDGERAIISPPPEMKDLTKMKTIEVKVARIQVLDRLGLIDGRGGKTAVVYDKSQPDYVSIYDDGVTQIPAEDIIKVAMDMQAQKRQEPVDVESDIDHATLLNEILKHRQDDDGSIQVLEGNTDSVLPEHFSGDNSESILEMVHFIEVNSLQEKRPWSTVWNLYRCMLVAAGRK